MIEDVLSLKRAEELHPRKEYDTMLPFWVQAHLGESNLSTITSAHVLCLENLTYLQVLWRERIVAFMKKFRLACKKEQVFIVFFHCPHSSLPFVFPLISDPLIGPSTFLYRQVFAH
ncbi:hypothetical protein DFR56_11177 [Pseudogracilibacillus auburnensis]|uniref:Uncharacterized protein n=1 Tax=Pseudogracilibacillus auburnensis TaxID=1494959 RepID=A0A2V3W994_9BACI|nr:hypothetical protein DFR56_11177 [Pseudogracilibacillus auburnensis]